MFYIKVLCAVATENICVATENSQQFSFYGVL